MAPMDSSHQNGSRDAGAAPAALLVTALAAALLLGACAGPRWNGKIEQHGSATEALHGMSPGIVRLSRGAREHRWGLGVVEHAAGEVLVADGYVWVGRAWDRTQARTDAGFQRGERAGWLALARVPRWREHVVAEPLDLEALGARVAKLARAEGWDPASPVPFAVVGELGEVELRIVRGTFPYAQEPSPDTEPFRTRFAVSHGTLVGVYAPQGKSELVYPGTHVHVHALLRQPVTLAAHVEAVRVLPGARLRVPLGR